MAFTLIETLTTIFIFGLILVLLSGFVFFLYRIHGYEWEQSLAISEAKRGIETMVKEIREAREGENGAYPIEYAGDKEFIFYSDIDNDGKSERVRYFLGKIETETIEKECESNVKGGSCGVLFSNFLKGNLKEATLKISVQGDLNSQWEYLTLNIDNQATYTFCQNESCQQCPNQWQATKTFDAKTWANDNQISIFVQASCPDPGRENRCTDPLCPFSFKAKFELTITQEIETTELKKGVIKPVGFPPVYPLEKEEIFVISSFVRNAPPIFEYFDQSGRKIDEYPARLTMTKVMKVFLVVNVDPNRPPNEYQLESFVQLRNLKNE